MKELERGRERLGMTGRGKEGTRMREREQRMINVFDGVRINDRGEESLKEREIKRRNKIQAC